MSQVQELLQRASGELEESDSPQLDAQLLLAKVLEVDRVWLMTWNDSEVSQEQEASFFSLLSRRKLGEPIAYILGSREFWGLEFACNVHTLIPRPDTEVLIEQILALDLPKQARVLDLGTGTGCIALSLALERPVWEVLASDFSAEAAAIAEQNRSSLKIQNAKIILSDWYDSISADARFDLIVSNPPYIDPTSPYLQEGDVRFEPGTALTSEKAGTAALAEVIGNAPNYLNDGGWVAVEHGFDQAMQVHGLLAKAGFKNIDQVKDLAGLDRCSLGQLL